ncbi:MAG TPA: AtpZ/AtpI family protein [Bacteroidia bacterium]|nr:AtpZ/AtpI family protein [Bacteroidia bacterium]
MTPQKPKPSSPKKRLNGYAKYLSMATYMAVIITLGTLGGRWLDGRFHFVKFPVFTLFLSLLSVFAAMWYFIRDFIRK